MVKTLAPFLLIVAFSKDSTTSLSLERILLSAPSCLATKSNLFRADSSKLNFLLNSSLTQALKDHIQESQ